MNTVCKPFDELTLGASQYLRNMGRSEESIRIYLWAWGRFHRFMDDHHIREYREEVVMKYIKSTYGQSEIQNLTHYQKDHLRQCICLIQFHDTGEIPIYIDRKPKYEITDAFRSVVDEYLDHKKSMRVSDITLKAHRWHLYQFSDYLISREVQSIDFLSPLELMYYASEIFPDEPAAKNQSLIVVRRFLNYLYDKGYIKRNLSQVVPKDNYRQQAKLPSVYTKDEIRQILQSIDRSTSIGKRNYVIILLAVRLGMRASDICALKFKHLNWSESKVSFTQMKTGRDVSLPLPSEVGEGIINYIKNGRPISNEKSIFLSPRYPHHPIEREGITHMVRKIIASSGVKIGNRKSGPHAMRHSMANNMINGGTTLPVIAEVLGHASVQTSMNYLRIDMESMRQCSMEVPLVPVSFYEQKGGEFYG